MWISEAEQQILATWVEHCPVLKLVSGPNGEIFWANRAFREFSEYTQKELQALGWKRLSVDGESLEADMDALNQMTSGYIQDYTVNKQYRTKSGAAKWGILTVLRYPAIGPIQCFLCTFEPLKNGTATAFDLAMERIGEMTTAINGVRDEVKTLTNMDADTTWVDQTIKGIKRHPKIAGALLTISLSVIGLNNVIAILQRVGLVEIPVKVHATTEDAQRARDIDGAHAVNIDNSSKPLWTATTPDGYQIEVNQSLQGTEQWRVNPKRHL